MTPLQLHATKWNNCTKCLLSKTRFKVVLGRGDVPCDVLFVGEAPGKSENVSEKAQAFVGPAGQELDEEILDAIGKERVTGSNRLRIGFTNVVGCIPIEVGEDGSLGKVHEPPEDAVRECLPRVKEFLDIAKPRLIFTVGRIAEVWLDPNKKKGLRTGIPQLNITHPAAILRAPDAQRAVMRKNNVLTIAEGVSKYINRRGQS